MTWPTRRRYRFIWWRFTRKQWMLREFHPIVGFKRFHEPESRVWRWVVWVGPLNFYRRGTACTR